MIRIVDFLGVFVRVVSVSGILLLMLYYFAGIPSVGHYWIIDRNLIEALLFLLVYLYPVPDITNLHLGSFLGKRRAKER